MPPEPRRSSRDADVIVVGGGPAGSAMATHMASAGHDVLLLDKAQFPRHKACSEYANPATADLLDDLGVLGEVILAGADRMDAMIVHAPDGSQFAADFSKAAPGREALGLSRYRLDHLLLERARDAGAHVVERAHVRQVLRNGQRVIGVEATIDGTRETLHAPLVVGADGHSSSVSREMGLDVPWRWPDRTGLVAHYRGVTGLESRGEKCMWPIMHTRASRCWKTSSPMSLSSLLPETSPAVPAASTSSSLQRSQAFPPSQASSKAPTGSAPSAAWDRWLAGREPRWEMASCWSAMPPHFLIHSLVKVSTRPSGEHNLPPRSPVPRSGRATPHWCPQRVPHCPPAGPHGQAPGGLDSQGFISLPPAMDYVTHRLAQREQLGQTLTGSAGQFSPRQSGPLTTVPRTPAETMTPAFPGPGHSRHDS